MNGEQRELQIFRYDIGAVKRDVMDWLRRMGVSFLEGAVEEKPHWDAIARALDGRAKTVVAEEYVDQGFLEAYWICWNKG